MQLNKPQYIAILISVLFFLAMYFGCPTKPKNIVELEKSRANSMEVTSIQNILNDAMKTLDPSKKALIETMTKELDKDTSKMIDNLKMLSSEWYKSSRPSIAGYYAEEVAKKINSAEAWSIAGTTYAIAVKEEKEEKIKEYSKARAIKALEMAISLEPENVDHRINLALCYVEKPDQDNPMKGILMLRELNTKYPQNVAVLNQLAKLALKTNQIERAIERLNQAIKIEPNNKNTICLLADAYEATGDKVQAGIYKKKCSN